MGVVAPGEKKIFRYTENFLSLCITQPFKFQVRLAATTPCRLKHSAREFRYQLMWSQEYTLTNVIRDEEK